MQGGPLAFWLGMTVTGGLAAACVTWRATRSIASRHRRLGARIACCPAAFLAAAWLASSSVGSGFDSGNWRCARCAASRDETRWNGIPLAAREPFWPPGVRAARARFHEWFATTQGVECPHDWEATGCHDVGFGSVRCAPFREAYYRLLPLFEEQEVARSTHAALLAAGASVRGELYPRFEEALAAESADPFEPGLAAERRAARRIASELRR